MVGVRDRQGDHAQNEGRPDPIQGVESGKIDEHHLDQRQPGDDEAGEPERAKLAAEPDAKAGR
jgi:hypothetical protein